MTDPTPTSELAKRIAAAVWDIEFGSTPVPEWANRVAEIISTAGLADLEAQCKAQDATIIRMGQELEAAEKLAHDRLNEIIELSHDLHIKLEAAERELAEARAVLREMIAAMAAYEMDVDETPPHKHREMMRRARLATGEGE